jgi:NAD dependent epimerase/dehydratase family
MPRDASRADYGIMRILVTGHRGYVGGPVAAHLRRLGHDVIGFDRADSADGIDLLDAAAVRRAADGCDAIVHLAAIPHDTAGSPEDIMAVNVLGTWHVLLAAEAARAGRVIHLSSVAVFGVAEGERLPRYPDRGASSGLGLGSGHVRADRGAVAGRPQFTVGSVLGVRRFRRCPRCGYGRAASGDRAPDRSPPRAAVRGRHRRHPGQPRYRRTARSYRAHPRSCAVPAQAPARPL